MKKPDRIKPVPGLDNNPADDGMVFGKSHPYITKAYPGAEEAAEKIAEKDFIRLEQKKLENWYKENMPEQIVGKFRARRFIVTRDDREIIINKTFYKEVAAHHKDDKYYLERLKLARLAHEWIKTAKHIGVEESRDHKDVKKFDIYEYEYKGVIYVLKCRLNSDGYFLHYMRRK